MGDPVKTKPSKPLVPILWEKENFTASLDGVDEDGDGSDFTRSSPDETAASDSSGNLTNEYVRIKGKTKFSGNFRFNPLAAGAKNLKKDGPTCEAFDEVHALTKVTSLFEYLKVMGLDASSFLKTGYKRTMRLNVNVNTEDICNAWYSPADGDLTFGTCEKMHTAACGDIVAHEFAHWLLDKLNPRLLEPSDVIKDDWWPVPHKLYAGEQDAIHEGFADAFAAIYHGNPVISEDSWVFTGKPEGEGLRTVENKAKRRSVGSDPHERGEVYGGFFWSLHNRIKALLAESRSAESPAYIAISLMWEHALHYRVAHPTTEQFVDAMLAGANALFNAETIALDPFDLRDAILDEALVRELVDKKYVAARKKKEDTGIPETLMLQQNGEPAFRSVKDAEEGLADHGRISFLEPKITYTASGVHEFHQQIYTTSDGKAAEVIGNGFVVERVRPKGVRFKRGGEFRHAFTDGVRNLSGSSSIDETTSYREEAAFKRFAWMVSSMAKKKAASLAALKKKRIKSEKERLGLGMLARDRAALKYLRESISEGSRFDAGLVILPGAKNLSWRFNAGEIVGYVDAKSGKVTLVRNFIID